MKVLLVVAVALVTYLWLSGPASVGQLNADDSYYYPGYTIASLESFRISGRVLSVRTYNSGREAELSPLDIALGWGGMADLGNINQLELAQRNRWLYWKAQRLPMPRAELVASMANIHIIPADAAVVAQLADLPVGVMVELHGDLVEARGEDGWRWRSSLSRTDTGAKSCELLLLRKVVFIS